MKFNEKIVVLRKIKGITQDELASAVGVSRQAVYKWESGQSYPEASKLLELKLLFNISIDDLLDDGYEIALPEKKKKKRLPKKEMESIEKEVRESMAMEAKAPEVKAETVAEAVPVAPATAPAVEKAEIKAEEKKAEPAVAATPAPEKKSGFFGRLFGRK